jgi:hypothetical protein
MRVRDKSQIREIFANSSRLSRRKAKRLAKPDDALPL